MRQRRYLTVRNGREQVRTIAIADEHRMPLFRVLSDDLDSACVRSQQRR
jgi:amide synthase